MAVTSRNTAAQGQQIEEDVWLASHCSMCFNNCGIKVHRVNGVVVKIEGNPDNPAGLGRLCPKGLSGIQVLYDPNRVNYPLRRTGPKGIGADPKWERITWDEAMDIIVEKLRKVRAENPNKLLFTTSVLSHGQAVMGFAGAFGTTNNFVANGHMCGASEHELAIIMHGGAITTNPDLEYTNYLLMFGSQAGLATQYALTTMTQRMAEARDRGMRLVVFDPALNTAAEKANEWVPIRPGTDGAVVLAMLNLLLNEYGIYDQEHLKHHTDSPYLVRPDGQYLRDALTAKPMVWDAAEGCAKTHDDETVGDFALEGVYEVEGVSCRPVFQRFKDELHEWTPERAAEISSVPSQTIRRIAREFGEAAQVGATITIDGHELPFRPVSAVYFKGAHGHDNSFATCHALVLMNEIVGASNVPGGLMACNPVSFGHPDTRKPRFGPKPDETTGLLRGWSPAGGFGGSYPDSLELEPYPATEPVRPDSYSLSDLHPWAFGPCMVPYTMANPERFGFDYRPEVLIAYGGNLLYTVAEPTMTFEGLKDCFVVSINIFVDETVEALADIVLPDASYLERLDWTPNNYRHHFPVAQGEWGCGIRQPIVPPMYERRAAGEILLDLSDRLGMLDGMYNVINLQNDLSGPYRLSPEEKYTPEEIADRVYKNWFGQEHGLDWFKKNGVIRWPKQVEEVYYMSFTHGRIPIYMEFMVTHGAKLKQLLGELGIDEVDTSSLWPLPTHWHPCRASRVDKPGFDLKAIYYKVLFHSQSTTFENPWLDEVSRMEGNSHHLMMNTKTAQAKGIKDGDRVWVESADAGRSPGRVKLTEGIHPDVVGIAHNGGHWSKGMPIARDKGVQSGRLIAFDFEHTDIAGMVLDADSRVRVYKA
ncbi:MAG: molybdopterin-dependent oxidoreductase [Dehalococcoidia bacterium]